ncbi:MAG: DUF3343 domain-containing protein [Anaerolineales bacterium]|nr:DUF3343 domain-containing protein [Anaerolineales bacterium]
MSDPKHAVILVYATSHALRAEQLLAEVGIQGKLIPVPRHLSSDCGVCLRIDQSAMEIAGQLLKNAGLKIQGISVI